MTAVLFVTPSEVSSGEAITVHHMAQDVRGHGGRVRCLASELTARYLDPAHGPDVVRLTGDAASVRATWQRELATFRPDVVVFADYPLLFLPSGSVPLADEAFVASLDGLDAAIATLDHIGYAQRPMTVYYGPPHLSFHGMASPALPGRMQVLLPCPVQGPADVPGRSGRPFRYWEVHDVAPRATDERLVVVHAVPNWAWRLADAWRLPYYRYLPRILAHLLADIPAPVEVISVNNGRLLEPLDDGHVRVTNAAPMPQVDFERLLVGADLVLTENAVSVGLGKAVCGLRPAGVLRNSRTLPEVLDRGDETMRGIVMAMERERLGAIFPWEVFPIWGKADLEQFGVYKGNPLADSIAWLEVFDAAATGARLRALLVDDTAREDARRRQAAYVEALAALPAPADVLEGAASTAGSPA